MSNLKILLNSKLAEQESYQAQYHIHGGARWFGATAAPPGGGVGPGLITSLNSFRLTTHATAMTFGTAITIFDGTEDFAKPEKVAYIDPHELFISNAESAGTYKIRFANSVYNPVTGSDTYASMAEAVAANKFTEVVFKADNTNAEAGPVMFMTGRMTVKSKLWGQAMQLAAGAKYIDFLIGTHTYSR